MARTAPVPNIPPIPGMCPSIAVMGGGGGGGGGSGSGAGSGDGSAGAAGDGSGADASGDEKNGGQGCGDPVCPITGRVFLEIYDFGFAGPLPLRFLRQYSSRASDRIEACGRGWTHSFAWRVEVRRAELIVYDDGARAQRFPVPSGAWSSAKHPLGYRIYPHDGGFLLTDRAGLRRQFGRVSADGAHHLIAVSDRNDNTIRLDRDQLGRLVGMTDSAGRPYRVFTGDDGTIRSVRVAANSAQSEWLEVARYDYDERQNLVAATDAEGFVARYAYDGHLLVSHQSLSGTTYRWRYDGSSKDARCVETWGDASAGMPEAVLDDESARGSAKGIFYQRFEYGPDFYTEVSDGLGGVTRFFGDPAGRVVKEVSPSGGVMERSFDPELGLVAAESREDGSERRALFNGARPAGYTTQDGRGIGASVDEEGYQVQFYTMKDGPPAVVRRKFDERGNLREVIHHDGSRESYRVCERGLVRDFFNRMGAVTQYLHDDQGNCVAVIRPGGLTERMEYDYLGRLRSFVDSAGRETRWEWDRRNEIVEKRVVGGGTYRLTYDAARKVTSLDENGRLTRYEYGGQDWLMQMVDPNGGVTKYRYDVQGRLRRVENPRGQRYTAAFDHAGRCREWTTFEGVRFTASHDGLDRPTAVRSPLGRTTLAYDEVSRLAEVKLSDGAEITFEYGGRGGPARVGGSLAPVERYQDALGRLHGEKLGQHALQVAWHAGSPRALVPDGGPEVRYGYDEVGELERVTIGSYERRVDRPQGAEQVSRLGPSLVLRRRYGMRGEVTFQCLARWMNGLDESEQAKKDGPGVLRWSEYEYDATLNLTRERRSDGSEVVIELDRNGQVVRRDRIARSGATLASELIGYDLAGSPRFAGAVYDATARVAEFRGERFEYDALGRLTKRLTDTGAWRYEWNGLDQLVRVVAPGHRVDITYDARGRRCRQRVTRGSELTKDVSYVWNNNVVVQEVDEISGSTRTYDRVDGSWLAYGHVDSSAGEQRNVHYYLDPTGYVECAVDDDGQLVYEAERSVYGEAEILRDDVGISFRLANQSHDADVGLAYTWHRWYDARLGVFVSADPLFLDGTPNPRDYAYNPLNPITGFDPTGWYAPPAGAVALAKPGPHAVGPGGGTSLLGMPSTVPGCVPCPSNMFKRKGRPGVAVQAEIDDAGDTYGCHSCGASSPGTTSGHWIGDHQPPLTTFGPGGPPPGANIQLFPHCTRCSPSQGGYMGHHGTSIGPGPALTGNLALGAT